MSRSMALANLPLGHWECPLLSAGHRARTSSKCLERGSPWAGNIQLISNSYSWWDWFLWQAGMRMGEGKLQSAVLCDVKTSPLYILNRSHCCSWGVSRLAVTVVDKLLLVQLRVDSSIQEGGSSLSRIPEHSYTKSGNTFQFPQQEQHGSLANLHFKLLDHPNM